MSLWRRPRRSVERTAGDSYLDYTGGVLRRGRADLGSVDVNQDTALRHSAVWACVRLRADHMSTLPVDVFRDHDGIAVEVKKTPQVFITPGGDTWPWQDWVWASQSDLDRTGNAVGLIVEKDPMGFPRTIALQNTRAVSVRVSRDTGDVQWMIDGKSYRPDQVWHERQFPVSGMVLGLSPVAYAAWTVGEAMSMQEFAMKWFGQGGVPRARLRNTTQTVTPKDAIAIKDRWKSSVEGGDLFVTGNDWEYDLIQAENAGMEWLEGRKASVPEIARYFGCPADMIDGAVTGGASITYANITQRNLQFLIHHLGPAVIRRELTWSRRLLPEPRYVKLNTDALLRMDPQTRETTIRSQLESKQITVTEARALNNRQKYTKEQEAEVEQFFPAKKAAAPTGGGAGNNNGNGNNNAPGQPGDEEDQQP